MVTGRPDEVPDAAPDEVRCDPLLRVLTGWLWLAGAGDVLCDPLLRVAIGAAEAVLCPLLVRCAPLARVATAAVPAVCAVRCPPLAAVRAVPRCPAITSAEEPRAPRSSAPGSWRITWIVRRITWVRTSTAGLRAASVAVDVPAAGLSANAARPPATAAMAIATMREYFLRIANASESWGRRDCAGCGLWGQPSEGKDSAKPTFFLGPRSDLFTREQQP